jgi:hypothetical protein
MFASLALLAFYLRRLGHVRVPYWGRWPGRRAVMYAYLAAGLMGLPLVTSTSLQLAVAGAAWLTLTIGFVAWHNHRVANAIAT